MAKKLVQLVLRIKGDAKEVVLIEGSEARYAAKDDALLRILSQDGKRLFRGGFCGAFTKDKAGNIICNVYHGKHRVKLPKTWAKLVSQWVKRKGTKKSNS